MNGTVTVTTVDPAAAPRLPRCRYLASGPRRTLDRCTAEVVDPAGEILLCIAHLARAMELVNRQSITDAL